MDNNEQKFNQAEYAKQYNKSHYKEVKMFVSENDKVELCEYCKDHKISQNKFLTACAKYCMKNSIDIDELLSYL